MNTETISMIATIVSAAASVAAVIIAYMIFRRQRNISLFQRRMEILRVFETFIIDVLPNTNWDGNIDDLESISSDELTTLFDDHFVSLQAEVFKAANEIYNLNGQIRNELSSDNPNYELVQQLDKDLMDTVLKVLREYRNTIDKHYHKIYRI